MSRITMDENNVKPVRTEKCSPGRILIKPVKDEPHNAHSFGLDYMYVFTQKLINYTNQFLLNPDRLSSRHMVVSYFKFRIIVLALINSC